MWTAAIIAGGRARRLGGRHKAALMLGAQTILERQIAVLSGVVDEIIMITAGTRADAYPAGLPVFTDLVPNAGSLGGLYTALCSAHAERTLAVGSDLPFLTAPFLRHLVALGQSADIVIPRSTAGHQPLCATYTRGCAGLMREHIDAGRLKLADLVIAAPGHNLTVCEIDEAALAPFDPDGSLLFNVNTPDDYERAIELHARRMVDTGIPGAR